MDKPATDRNEPIVPTTSSFALPWQEDGGRGPASVSLPAPEFSPYYQGWYSFRVDTTGKRIFRERGWILDVPSHADEEDWSADIATTGDDWETHLHIPIAKLGIQAPLSGRLMGINIEHESNLGMGLWQPMLRYPVMPHEFGRMLFAEL